METEKGIRDLESDEKSSLVPAEVDSPRSEPETEIRLLGAETVAADSASLPDSPSPLPDRPSGAFKLFAARAKAKEPPGSKGDVAVDAESAVDAPEDAVDDVPVITVTKSSSGETVTSPTSTIGDKNANIEKTRKGGLGVGGGLGIQFSDVVLSAISSPVTQQTSVASSQSAIEICVYLMDNSGLTFLIEDGRTATADAILDLVLEEVEIPKRYKACFGIWLSSPLLHLQLRPYHVPHRMAKQWGDLLVKFTLASMDQLETDEPILRLQRNAFLNPSADLDIDDRHVTRLLYCEAKENVLEGLYPLDVDTCFRLSGLISVAECGPHVPDDHDNAFYRPKIPSLLPDWIEKSKAAFLGCSGSSLLARVFSRTDKVREKISFDLQRAHKTETERLSTFTNLEDGEKNPNLLAEREFLRHCYKLPFYSCAFFRGILYKPASVFSTVWNLDKGGVDATYPVTVAVSLRGLSLLDLSVAAHSPGSLLLTIPYSQLYWMTAELDDPEDEPGLTLASSTSPAVLPSLFLHFALPDEDGRVDEAETMMLQIVTKQAPLVDALMQACVQLRRTEFLKSEAEFDPKKTVGVSAKRVFGEGVSSADLERFPFDWRAEETILNSGHETDQPFLSRQLERLRLEKALDFDEE